MHSSEVLVVTQIKQGLPPYPLTNIWIR